MAFLGFNNLQTKNFKINENSIGQAKIINNTSTLFRKFEKPNKDTVVKRIENEVKENNLYSLETAIDIIIKANNNESLR